MKLNGKHVVADFFDCTFDLNKKQELLKLLVDACDVAKATICKVSSYDFQPQGFTAFVVLAESHLSIHTFPEEKTCAIDCFTCGKTCQPEQAVRFLENHLKPALVNVKTIVRKCN